MHPIWCASSSRTRSHSRGRSYTDGVYTPTEDSFSRSASRSRSRSRKRTRSPSRASRARSYSRSPSSSPSRSLRASSKRRNPLAHVLDTSASTKSEKAENIAKTSLVMLGAIGAATLAAHKLWPKGVTYGEKEEWECEKEKAKDKMKDAKAAVTGGMGGEEVVVAGEEEEEQEGEEEERHLIATGAVSEGRDTSRTEAFVTGTAGRRDNRGREQGYPQRDEYDDMDYDLPRERRDRYVEAPPPPPAIAMAGPAPQRMKSQRRVVEQYHAPPAPVPPPAPNPPPVYREVRAEPTPVVIDTGARGRGDSERGGGGGRYYVEGDTFVVPSRGETEFVVRRDGPAGNRVTVERDGRYYR
ncbi:hypothetical protein VP1G_07576 [Cytospora mali]|uniref:Uncharacterized protein n=1 Tax=Cytospora mali TaxID=578113 RepID=A0A194V916_CYTMA|nr:hypothetical protein VP1G_07576 [Valsa mali var. pyri (nom. inval.)]